MKWRKWNNIIHRDLGYLAFGLTVIYAISGVAVNHVHDWNPNYKVEKSITNIGAIADSSTSVTPAMLKSVLAKLGRSEKIKNIHPTTPKVLQVFLDGSTLSINVATGEVEQEVIRDRRGLREMNFLHLNHPKKLWTFVADLYALVLLILAITGLFVLKGKKGITGRGAWLTAIGIIIPLFFLWLYY